MDTFYVQPQQSPSVNNMPTFIYYPLLVLTVLFSVVSLFFLPIDLAAIKMSMDPGFTVFFILVIVIFSIKIANLIWFYMIITTAGTNTAFNIVNFIVLILGTLFVGGSLVVVFVEIYLLTNSILAALCHPFVIDFLLFMLCNILAHVGNCMLTPSQGFAYMPVPQRRMVYQMEAPVELKEMPATVAQVPIQYPELPVHIAPEPIQYPDMPFYIAQPRPPKFPEMPMSFVMEAPKKAEAPKVQPPIGAFVPYYFPK